MSEEIQKAVEAVSKGFEEFKATNDARLREIEKRGSADVIVNEKLERIEKNLSGYEDLNQKLVQAEAKAKALEEAQAASANLIAEIEAKMGRPAGNRGEFKRSRADEWARAVMDAHTKGVPNLSADQQKVLADVAAEYKALTLTPDTAGGYLAPVEMVNDMLKTVTEISPMRSIVTVRQTALRAVSWPKRTGQFAAQWVAENGTKAETTGLAFGGEEITAHEMFALVDISNQMLEDSAFSLEAFIQAEASEQFALAEGAAIVSGNGVGKPEGFLSNASIGEKVSGSAAGIADSAGQANGLIDLFHDLKTVYTRDAQWLLNRRTIGAVRKLKDTTGQYIWQPGVAGSVPNTILGNSYVEVPDMPDIAANAYPIAFGDFRRGYVMVDRISMEMLRDPYTQATTGNVRFIFRKRLGGKVVMAEAMKKLKCST